MTNPSRSIGMHVSAPFDRFEMVPSVIQSLDWGPGIKPPFCGQIFIGVPRTFKAHSLSQKEVEKFQQAKIYSSATIYAHAPYVVHAFSKDVNRVKNLTALKEHLKLAGDLGLNGYVLHMGATSLYPDSQINPHSLAAAIEYITLLCEFIGRDILSRCPILLENSASGNFLSGDLHLINKIVNSLLLKGHNVGVCLDTLHAWSWGFNTSIKLETDPEAFENVHLIHLNSGPSDFDFGCKRDRHHELIGGCVPPHMFVKLLRKLPSTPVILERDEFLAAKRDMSVISLIDEGISIGMNDQEIVNTLTAKQIVDKLVNSQTNPPFDGLFD